MYNNFDKIEDLPAMLIVNRREQGECDVRLRYNPYDLNNMEAELFDAPTDLDIPGLPDEPSFADYDELDARLVTEGHGRKYTLRVRPTSLSNFQFRRFQGRHSITVPVERYESNRTWDPEHDNDPGEEVRVIIQYRFPLTTAVRSRGMATRDARHGYYRGSRDPDGDIVEINKDSFRVDTSLGTAEFCETFGMDEDTSNRFYPAVLLVRRSECLFRSTCQLSEADKIIGQAREEIDSLLKVLNFAEQNRINWSVEKIEIKPSQGHSIRSMKTYRWSSPPSDKYSPDKSRHREARKAFTALWDEYRHLNGERMKLIDQALNNITSAHCTNTLETELVFYHACLDHLLKVVYGNRVRPFSRRVVEVCDQQGVDISDILEKEVIDYFLKGQKGDNSCFWFVDARNRLVHEGLFQLTDTPYKLINAIRSVRAVTERLLMKALDIDHNELFDANQMRPGAISI